MARRRPARGRGLWFDAEGLEELVDDLAKDRRAVPRAARRTPEGAGGEAIAANVRKRMPRRSNELANSVKVRKEPAKAFGGAGAVEVGVGNGSHRGSDILMRSLGAIVESGSLPHEINPGARRGGDRNARHGLKMRSGQFVNRVMHPGTKPKRIMSKSVRASKAVVETIFIQELRRELGADT
ncbi:MAG: hypothetical protein H7123_00435 [Thermoleophilia bacterium]|nr:hypothetical protein [Thermoleophilia bacterium]